MANVNPLVIAGLLFVAPGADSPAQPITLVNAFPGLSFSRPLLLTHAPDGTNRVFVVQQTGQVLVFQNDSAATATAGFLDITSKLSAQGGEEGLLGLAFHPSFAVNRTFYINYTAPAPPPSACRTVIARYTVPPGSPNAADPLSEVRILEIDQPYSNHNGGMIAFGNDGYLYIGMGDGGDGNDPGNVAQNRSSLLGKFLRINVDDTTGGKRYGIPPDNPYAGNTEGFRQEIYAYGFRNPWRFSIDGPTGEIWAGDVGQGTREEIDLVRKGGNYGWKIMEGSICRPPTTGCDTAGLILPVRDYGRSLGFSVTGGYVYRGSARPGLRGAYIYGDYGSGRIWMLRRDNGVLTADSLLIDTPHALSSFGTDSNGELYMLTRSGSVSTSIYRFAALPATSVRTADDAGGVPVLLDRAFPNPCNPSITLRFHLAGSARTRLAVYDLLGRIVLSPVDGDRAAGEHEVQIDVSRFASGMYIYRLTAHGRTESRTFIVAR
jgi:glucose/arabinose dehydrogenase